MDVLVVESPAKAKTIGKYLGPGFTVLAFDNFGFGLSDGFPRQEARQQLQNPV